MEGTEMTKRLREFICHAEIWACEREQRTKPIFSRYHPIQFPWLPPSPPLAGLKPFTSFPSHRSQKNTAVRTLAENKQVYTADNDTAVLLSRRLPAPFTYTRALARAPASVAKTSDTCVDT